jgi:pyruvate/oxaloacetate carboxyltransferase
MGGDVFNLEYYLSKAKEIQDMGADSLCLKDMAGIMAPFDIAKLVTEFKKVIRIPIHLHTHYTSGMASMVYLEAIKAGVDIVDTCLAPFALRTSQPAVEPIVAALVDTDGIPASISTCSWNAESTSKASPQNTGTTWQSTPCPSSTPGFWCTRCRAA